MAKQMVLNRKMYKEIKKIQLCLRLVQEMEQGIVWLLLAQQYFVVLAELYWYFIMRKRLMELLVGRDNENYTGR